MFAPRGIRGDRLDRPRGRAAVSRRLLLLAYYDPEGWLTYAGRVGTGINTAELERLWRRLQPLATSTMPLDVPPSRSTRFGSPLVLSRVHWVRPERVAEVKFLTWTDDNLLRQVVYEVYDPTSRA
jgi:ATP-dependent DNA ligase